MRQLFIHVERGHGQHVAQLARENGAFRTAYIEGQGTEDQNLNILFVTIQNNRLEGLLRDLEEVPVIHITLIPREVIAFQPPASEVPEQVTTMHPLSPLEIFLAGLQSMGKWGGFVAYAVAGAIIVWIAMFTNSIYLLVASMLIAPFAGPAMNTALATATGDLYLFKQALLRYFVSIFITILATALLSWVLNLETATNLMIDVSHVSGVAALLPAIAGMAGGLNLVQSERSSLVSGAAVGVLVAASLAPPAGLIGMAWAIEDWSMVGNAAFVLALQLIGINLAGSVVFRLYGVNPDLGRYKRGQRWLFLVSMVVSAVLLVGLLSIQFSSPLRLQRASQGRRVVQQIQDVVKESELAEVVRVQADFTAPVITGDDTLLVVVYVKIVPGVEFPNEVISSLLKEDVEQKILEMYGGQVVPLVEVHVLQPPVSGQVTSAATGTS
jgi:uncharacterized membrane protein